MSAVVGDMVSLGRDVTQSLLVMTRCHPLTWLTPVVGDMASWGRDVTQSLLVMTRCHPLTWLSPVHLWSWESCQTGRRGRWPRGLWGSADTRSAGNRNNKSRPSSRTWNTENGTQWQSDVYTPALGQQERVLNTSFTEELSSTLSSSERMCPGQSMDLKKLCTQAKSLQQRNK